MAETDHEERQRYLDLFDSHKDAGAAAKARSKARSQELKTTPLLSLKVKTAVDKRRKRTAYPQYGVLGYHIGEADDIGENEPILLNTNTPLSTFICGSQGAGKSFTLAAMLENSLLPDTRIGKLREPPAGIVFHFDRDGGERSLAETVDMCSHVKVKVLVSRTNYGALRNLYERRAGVNKRNLTVLPLMFQDEQLKIDRIHKLMSFSSTEGNAPLYMGVIQKILQDISLVNESTFSFKLFDDALEDKRFSESQQTMLNQRMLLLNSCCATPTKQEQEEQLERLVTKNARKKFLQSQPPIPIHNVLELEPGTLTIVDLSDPFINDQHACMLFDICLSIFKTKPPPSGIMVTLDEAHKFLKHSPAAEAFVDSILDTIRLQRHCAARVVVATQEPTISDKLLDLCTVSIIHRFTSPAWFAAIKEHLGGASSMTVTEAEQREMFKRIVSLEAGESLVFAPLAFLGTEVSGRPKRLGTGCMKMKTRLRITKVGGGTQMAVSEEDDSDDMGFGFDVDEVTDGLGGVELQD